MYIDTKKHQILCTYSTFNKNDVSNSINRSCRLNIFNYIQYKKSRVYEAIALDRMFHGQRALISSTKSMTGHECWMAGASEIVYSIIMMQNNFIAPNLNFENPDEYSEKLNLATQTINMEVNTVLSNSFGFGGTNSALIIKKQ